MNSLTVARIMLHPSWLRQLSLVGSLYPQGSGYWPGAFRAGPLLSPPHPKHPPPTAPSSPSLLLGIYTSCHVGPAGRPRGGVPPCGAFPEPATPSYGAPGVEFMGLHLENNAVVQIHFLPGQVRPPCPRALLTSPSSRKDVWKGSRLVALGLVLMGGPGTNPPFPSCGSRPP